MATMTLEVPAAQIGWFEQMVRTMGWTFTRNDSDKQKDSAITPALRKCIATARKESAEGQTIVCHTPEDMQRYFDSL